VTIAFPVTEGLAKYLYDLAYDQVEFYIDANYYGSKSRRAIGCKIDNLSFTCEAGSVVQGSMSIIAKSVSEKKVTHTYTKGEKLLTWDKSSVTFIGNPYPENEVQSFTYNVSNGIKTIKTAGSLDPTILTTAIQDINGQIEFYNYNDLGLPLKGDKFYDLGFNDMIFRIGKLTIRHNAVFNPAESAPLTPGPVITMVTWVRSDDFYKE